MGRQAYRRIRCLQELDVDRRGGCESGALSFDVWNSEDGRLGLISIRQKRSLGPRALHYTVVFRDRIWVMGGQTIPQIAKGKRAVLQ